MAKDTRSSSKQEKVTLRATPVGSRVMERLSLPNIDKSAELRRFIELGYACEQAGFILDGETLRHGGRVWDGDLTSTSVVQAVRGGAIGNVPSRTTSNGGTPEMATDSEQDTPRKPVSDKSEQADPVPVSSSPLMSSLRALSG